MLTILLLYTQTVSPEAAISLRDLVQYIANGAAVGAFVFAWRTNTELTRIKTVLMEPQLGLVSVVSRLREASELRGVQTPPDFPGIHPQEHPTRKRP